MRITNSCCDVDLPNWFLLWFWSWRSNFVIVKSANHFIDLVKMLLQLRNLVETWSSYQQLMVSNRPILFLVMLEISSSSEWFQVNYHHLQYSLESYKNLRGVLGLLIYWISNIVSYMCNKIKSHIFS